MSVISKGNTDHPSTPMPQTTCLESNYSEIYCQTGSTTSLQFSNTFPDNTVEGGKHIPVTEWCWAVKSDKFILVLTDLEAATQCILK